METITRDILLFVAVGIGSAIVSFTLSSWKVGAWKASIEHRVSEAEKDHAEDEEDKSSILFEIKGLREDMIKEHNHVRDLLHAEVEKVSERNSEGRKNIYNSVQTLTTEVGKLSGALEVIQRGLLITPRQN